jgi:predicted ribonuclease YlaK
MRPLSGTPAPLKALRIDDLRTFQPLSENQDEAFTAWKHGDHLVLQGSAGTGKSFIALYLALESVLNKSTPYKTVHIIRSVVATRDIGFMPGTYVEKLDLYTGPYRAICAELFESSTAYDSLVKNGQLIFESTSYLRGLTFDDSVVIVDECQNMNFHELDSIITRVGHNCRIMFCGDYYQSDLKNVTEAKQHLRFMEIVELLKNFTSIQFTWEDIVRSDFVRDYIMTKEMKCRGKDRPNG